MMNQQSHILTAEESAFAAEHHHLIYTYLANRHLPAEEFYDVVVFGYLNGVRKHFRREDLHFQFPWLGGDTVFGGIPGYQPLLDRPFQRRMEHQMHAVDGSGA